MDEIVGETKKANIQESLFCETLKARADQFPPSAVSFFYDGIDKHLKQQMCCSKTTSSKPSKMRYLKAAKFQHVKLKNLNTDFTPIRKTECGKG